jgi:three-Cys-motif partner protein
LRIVDSLGRHSLKAGEATIPNLITGDDALPAEEVGLWAKEKHGYLRRYIDISRGARAKWLGPGKAGATYIDLFCGPGRARIGKSGEWIDGSCVAAWKESVRSRTPFSAIYIGDSDEERRGHAARRLQRLGAPVIEVSGDASSSVTEIVKQLNPYGLHFAFIDPYNIGSFDFDIINVLSRLNRIDVLVHVSKMDLQRNLRFNVAAERSAFDRFAPGWREAVNLNQKQAGIRRKVLDYWRSLVESLA